MSEESGNPGIDSYEFKRAVRKAAPSTTVQTWTPIINQPGALNFTNRQCFYIVRDNLVFIHIDVTVTSAGTAGQGISVSGLPVAILNYSGSPAIGIFNVWTGAAAYVGSVHPRGDAANVLAFFTNGGTSWFGTNPNYGLANTHRFSFTAEYRYA